MVTLNRIYTRTGDGGATRLASGAQVSKTDPRVEAYGSVDEANAAIGLARLSTAADQRLDPILQRVQNDLFDLGADLATPETEGGPPKLRIAAGQVGRLETEIDALNAELAPLTSFVLPGGSAAAAALHVARTVCRRAERRAWALIDADAEQTNPVAVTYLNRLSDLLFILARLANPDGDVRWVPGANR